MKARLSVWRAREVYAVACLSRYYFSFQSIKIFLSHVITRRSANKLNLENINSRCPGQFT